jgi:hypothetical protein
VAEAAAWAEWIIKTDVVSALCAEKSSHRLDAAPKNQLSEAGSNSSLVFLL